MGQRAQRVAFWGLDKAKDCGEMWDSELSVMGVRAVLEVQGNSFLQTIVVIVWRKLLSMFRHGNKKKVNPREKYTLYFILVSKAHSTQQCLDGHRTMFENCHDV